MTDPTVKLMVTEAAQLAADRAVENTLKSLGVDTSDPFETQKDMAALREMRLLLRDPEFQADLAQIRALRTSGNFIRSNVTKTVIGVIVTGLLGLAWINFKSAFGF